MRFRLLLARLIWRAGHPVMPTHHHKEHTVRRFHLQRDTDVSGVSGTGRVAEGIEFTDGTVVIHWIAGEHHSTVVWADMSGPEAIHGHSGATQIVWED